MPRKKPSRKLPAEDIVSIAPMDQPQPKKYVKIVILLLVIGLVALFFTNKGLLLAATVNGKPIFRWDLNNVLVSRFGSQTLDAMVSEALIEEEAKKAGVSVTQADVDVKTQSLVESIGGGMTLDQLLQYQGMSRADFESQLKLQLTVEKLLGKDISVTEDDVTNYIATAAATLTATDEAGMREEARQTIFSQKISEKLQPWFSEIRTKASIVRFL